MSQIVRREEHSALWRIIYFDWTKHTKSGLLAATLFLLLSAVSSKKRSLMTAITPQAVSVSTETSAPCATLPTLCLSTKSWKAQANGLESPKLLFVSVVGPRSHWYELSGVIFWS